jgi:uncharacterized protein YndB with AHSA1/START domain
MILDLDPELDLRIDRVIRAPRSRVWKAWTDPLDLARWWLPAPMHCRVEQLDVVSGGAFVTSMSEDGSTFGPHLDACFVVVDPGERIVFTNALDSRWRPTHPAPVAMTAEITFGDHPQGTDYRIAVRHADAGSRTQHEQLGFADGWGAVVAQLAAVAEAGDGRPGERP